MRAVLNKNGLYTFDFTLQFKNKTKILTGLVDTGSNICVCSYKIPTTLRARPTGFSKISSPIASDIKALGYSIKVGFDNKFLMTHVYRLPLQMTGIDLILGLSVLSHCKIEKNQDEMIITWLD